MPPRSRMRGAKKKWKGENKREKNKSERLWTTVQRTERDQMSNCCCIFFLFEMEKNVTLHLCWVTLPPSPFHRVEKPHFGENIQFFKPVLYRLKLWWLPEFPIKLKRKTQQRHFQISCRKSSHLSHAETEIYEQTRVKDICINRPEPILKSLSLGFNYYFGFAFHLGGRYGFSKVLSFYPDQTSSGWSWSRKQTLVINRSRRRRQQVTGRAGESTVWGSDPR